MVVRAADESTTTKVMPDLPDATMALPRPESDDPNATMVVRPASDDSPADATSGAEPAAARRPSDAAPADDEDETPIEVLEELTGTRARAADDETPPGGHEVGSRS
jgi:hypothetical protein